MKWVKEDYKGNPQTWYSDDVIERIRQRQQIGYMRKLLNLDEDVYREMLFNDFGVDSSKDLTMQQAGIFLNKLRDIGKASGVFKPVKQYGFQKYKYNNFENRDPMMASPKQLRMVEALWYRISRQKTDKERADALENMLFRICGKYKMQFLTKSDISKVIKAFKSMSA